MYERLTVFIGRKCSSIDVQVGIYLNGGHAQPVRLQQGAYAAGDDAFAHSAYHPATNQYVLYWL